MSTYCLTPNESDFIGSTHDINVQVRGVSGAPTKVTKFGQGVFKLVDDLGATCKIPIPELYMCPTVPFWIISPQHIDELWKRNKIGRFAEATDSDRTLVKWQLSQESGSHTRHIKLCTRSGVPLCNAAPDYSGYH
jgi:hypothetical protein